MSKKNKIVILSVVLALTFVSESALLMLGRKAEWIWLLPWFLFSVFMLVLVVKEGQPGKEANEAGNEKPMMKKTPGAADTQRKKTKIVPLYDDNEERMELKLLLANKEITLRLYNLLYKRKITNLGQLTMYHSSEILCLSGMGAKSKACLLKVMRKYGIHFITMAQLKKTEASKYRKWN